MPVPLVLQPGDAAAYDMFGPSGKHTDAALAEVALAAAPAKRSVVMWLVDSIEGAVRAARLGADIVVSNDPLELKSKLAAGNACTAGGTTSGGMAEKSPTGSGVKTGQDMGAAVMEGK